MALPVNFTKYNYALQPGLSLVDVAYRRIVGLCLKNRDIRPKVDDWTYRYGRKRTWKKCRGVFSCMVFQIRQMEKPIF